MLYKYTFYTLLFYSYCTAASIVFQGACSDKDVFCEQLCLTISPETYECACWDGHQLKDDGLSCRVVASPEEVTPKQEPQQTTSATLKNTSPFSISSSDVPVKVLPTDTEPPLRFNGHNYAQFPVDDDFYLETNITLEFKFSSLSDGLLLFAGEFHGDDFLSIALQGPNVILRYDCGEGVIEDLYRGPFGKDQWHTLTVYRKYCERTEMQIDKREKMRDETEMFKFYKGITVDDGIFVGGAPSIIDFLEGRASTDRGFNGCIGKIVVNNKMLLNSKEGVNNAVNREKLVYCEDVASAEQLDRESIAEKETVGERVLDGERVETTTEVIREIVIGEMMNTEFTTMFFLTGLLYSLFSLNFAIPFDYYGLILEQIFYNHNLTGRLPGKVFERTISGVNRPQLVIPKEKKNEQLMEKMETTIATTTTTTSSPKPPMHIVEFSRTSYITVSAPPDINEYMEIVVNFKPKANQGILLFWRDGHRHLVLYLDGGFLSVDVSMGADTVLLRSENILALHKWHKVEMWRSGKGILLKVNHQSWIESELSSLGKASETPGEVYIGGTDRPLPSHLQHLTGFHGCMKKIHLNSHPLPLSTSPSLNIRECGSDPCSAANCPGNCHSRHDKFVCICNWPNYGKTCTIKGSTSPEAMRLDGHSYLEFTTEDYMNHITGDSLQLTIEFKLRNDTMEDTVQEQVLAYAGAPDGSVGDFLRLVVTRDRTVRFITNLGSGTAELTHPTVVDVDKWVTVEVTREKRHLRLSINGLHPVNTNTPEGSEQLNVYRSFFIGGYESDNWHSEGLHGCIQMIQIANRVIRNPSDATTAVNIGECYL